SESVHRIPTDGDPVEAASRYARDLRGSYEERYGGTGDLVSGKPLFDVVLLGLGENGHTASLFPRTDVLQVEDAWVGTCVPDDAPDTRITLTYPAIRSSGAVLFLVTGKGKAPVVAKVREKDPEQPSSRIASEGELIWVLDEEAASAVRPGTGDE
ncbi:6-phosphogluconolactonase, partial [Jatrophihabitans endophyticus]|uniref:6-phosphogluconolactonase n=1 Tax=Jatrophihabitans endophyticus TaxID=1206085 RepID=UPI0019EB0C52